MKTTLRSARQSSSASWASPFVTAVVLALSSAAHAENVAPTDISLSSSSIEENNAANATVGTLTATDEDAGDTHTFSLVSGDGDTDNASFTIAGDELKLSPVADYESKTNYSVRVQADDGNGGTFAKALSVTINNVIETPMVTSPTSTSITATGATLGGEVSAASDPGTEIGIVYSLTADNGDPLIGDTGVTKVTGSGTTGVFTVGVTGLTAGTGYTFKAYASNTAGTGYSAPATFTTEKISQTITFTNPGSKTYGAAPFGLVATGGDSGNAVTFSIVTGPASVSGSTLTITGAGDVTVRASQAGNDTYSAAPDVEQTFTVAAKELTLANAAVAIKPYDGNTAATITGTLSGIVGSDDVTFVGTGTFASSAIGTGISVTAAITLAGADAGNYTFTQPTGLTGTIVAGQITFSPVDYAAAQSDGSVTLTLVRDGGPAATVTLAPGMAAARASGSSGTSATPESSV
jgi:hypothetical protein